MRVAIRVDASSIMGTGHLRRCLSLAQALQEQGAEVRLLVRPLDAVAAQVLQQSPVPVTWLPAAADPPPATLDDGLPPHQAWARVRWQQDVADTCAALHGSRRDWVVVDHYAFDARWHEAVRQGLGCRVLVVDDIADRPLSPDILLDHNWAPDHRAKYSGRLRTEPDWLVGPRYALLAPVYRTAPRYRFAEQVRSLGVFMGGTDPGGVSARVLRCIRAEAGFAGPVEVVSTSANPHLGALRAACAQWPATTLTLDEPDLAAFFARHDLHVGAGGGATWERCCIGAPTIAIVVARNQAASVPALHELGALRIARLADGATGSPADRAADLAAVLRDLLEDAKARRQLTDNASALVDGRGAERAALRLTRGTLHLRPATLEDAAMLHRWRNHPAVRGVSLSNARIDYDDHVAWMDKVLRASDRWLLVAQVGALAVGSIRFDRLNDKTLEVSLYLDPGLQGLGLGRELLLQGEQYMSRLLRDELSIHATVTPGNLASCRLFESCAYLGGPTIFTKAVPTHRQESASAR